MTFRASTILRKVSSFKFNVQLSSRAKGGPKKIGAAGYLFLVRFANILIQKIAVVISLKVAPATTFCLGVWQYNRRTWKINMIEELQEKVRHATPTSLKWGFLSSKLKH